MDNKTAAELLPEFYKEYNLGMEGGKNSASVRIEMTKKFVLYFPNFTARKKAVLKHDIHHLVTDYPSTFKGETEISAWEIASGCKKYRAAWVLDMSGMMIGIVFNFRGVLKAFARGRRTKNLYYDVISTEEALDMKLSELKKLLWLDKYPKNTRPVFVDFILFVPLLLIGIIYSILSLILLPFIIIYSIYISTKLRLQH
ncbi:MAG TPA: hypothetical protein VKC90_10390 [Chitinophagaceae bacterium]|nr:hypothetical protein [Chitinophagaceae bacterium]